MIVLFSSPLMAQEDRAEAQKNPYANNAGAVAAGHVLYNQTCVACHGTEARGDRAPSVASSAFARGGADGEIFIKIRSGIRGTQMPGFSQFTTEQTWRRGCEARALGAPQTKLARA
jgi:mono/diheme cytochrome c family protein